MELPFNCTIKHSENLVVSASEDGKVMFWDQRKNVEAFSLEPSKSPNINRPSFGHWIGSANINKEWAVVGGGETETSLLDCPY
jgi:hypothetical protein